MLVDLDWLEKIAFQNYNTPWSLYILLLKLAFNYRSDKGKCFKFLPVEELNRCIDAVLEGSFLRRRFEEGELRYPENGLVEKLFAFDMDIPPVSPGRVAGNIVLQGEEQAVYRDLIYLSLKCTKRNTNSNTLSIADYKWGNLSESDISGNKAEFAFDTKNGIAVDRNGSDLIQVEMLGVDGTEYFNQTYESKDTQLEKLLIKVPIVRPAKLGLTTQKPDELAGRLIDLSNNCDLKDVSVVFQAKRDLNQDEDWETIGLAISNQEGRFSLPYPKGNLVRVRAIVSTQPSKPIEIRLRASDKDNNSSAEFEDSQIFLLLEEGNCAATESECECGEKSTPRLPSQGDLIGSDKYTQDLGSHCVSLTTPNRTLHERNYYAIVRTSDPKIATYVLRKNTSIDDYDNFQNVSFEFDEGLEVSRNEISFLNPIRWHDSNDRENRSNEMKFCQAVSIATGHILRYKAVLKADGYSLGDLVYSLPLAPGQKKQIVSYDWNRRLSGKETQRLSQRESVSASMVSDRTLIDSLGGDITETIRGSSSASTGGFSAGLGAAFLGKISAVLGVGGGTSNSSSSAFQTGSRQTSQSFSELLRQSIQQSASSYREMNGTLIQLVDENQKFSTTAEVVANHNHCHSMTMLYFEVLRHFAVYQELASVEECLFVPLIMKNFTRENIYKWRDVLSNRLLRRTSSTYLSETFGNNPLRKAFDANERVLTNWNNSYFPTGRYCDDPITSIKGWMDISVLLKRPSTYYDRILSLPLYTKTESVDRNGFFGSVADFFIGKSTVSSLEIKDKVALLGSFIDVDENFRTVKPAQCIRIRDFGQVFGSSSPIQSLFDNSEDKRQWLAIASILGKPVQKLFEDHFGGQLLSDWDYLFNRDIVPKLFRKIIDSLQLSFFGLDFTVPDYQGGEQRLRLYFSGPGLNKSRKELPPDLVLRSLNQDILELGTSMRFDIRQFILKYTTDFYEGFIFQGNANFQDVLDFNGAKLHIPMNREEQRNPRQDDKYIVNELIAHLNENIEYYNKALWYDLDVDRRYMLLDGFNVQTYDQQNNLSASRSLASVVKNQLIGIAGNSLVFPVAAGVKVDRSYEIVKSLEGEKEISLFDHYRPITPSPPFRISLPTRGIYAEAIQGACDSCEMVKPNSSQDWTKFQADEPTAISTVPIPVPTATDWKPSFKDFASPIVNIQNAPSEPAPGAGLAGLSALLSNNSLFKDVTGLDANQKNALATFLSTQDSAKAFAQMAKDMANQTHATQKYNEIQAAIDSAQRSGMINKEDANKATKNLIQHMIDGGEAKRVESTNTGSSKPSLTDAAIKAADEGRPVKAQRQDPSGSSETLEIGSSSSTRILAEVKGAITRLVQPNSRSCWATVATMMLSWKLNQSLAIDKALGIAGDYFLDVYKSNDGLKSEDKDRFLNSLGLVGEPPANYDLKFFVDRISKYGPLWITTDSLSQKGEFASHARLLFKIEGTRMDDLDSAMLTFVDPATGKDKTERFLDFIQSFEQMVTDNPSVSLFKQIVRFADETVVITEGSALEGSFNINDPVHEKMTVIAILNSNYRPVTSFELGVDATVNEILRGVIWNDDPHCLLFDDRKKDNWNWSSGALWYFRFNFEWDAFSNMTYRSHNGDLQFLHSMASKVGEDPAVTRAKCLVWAEVMYKLSIGAISEKTELRNVNVSRSTTYPISFASFFSDKTDPSQSKNLEYLLTRGTDYDAVDIQRRALGSVIHLIQDSYAHGHTLRVLLNKSDLVVGSSEKFNNGTWGKYGSIMRFHTYHGQDKHAHKKYDNDMRRKYWWQFRDSFNLDLNSFNEQLGARDAIDKTINVINFWFNRTSYTQGPESLFDSIFSLDPSVQPADGGI